MRSASSASVSKIGGTKLQKVFVEVELRLRSEVNKCIRDLLMLLNLLVTDVITGHEGA